MPPTFVPAKIGFANDFISVSLSYILLRGNKMKNRKLVKKNRNNKFAIVLYNFECENATGCGSNVVC